MKRSRWTATVSVVVLLLLTVAVVSAATYIVQPGDTLWGLSGRFGTTVDAIVQANNIPNPNLIYVGQVLEIPGAPTAVPPGPTATPGPVQPTPVPPAQQTYVVQPGDNLTRIAARFNTTVQAIVQANNIVNPNLIFVGQVLVIPGTGPVPTAVPPVLPTAPGVTPVPPPTGFAFGGQSQTFANVGAMQGAQMGWAKYQHKWTPGESADAVGNIIDDLHADGLKVLVTVSGMTPYPAANTIDFAALTTFMSSLAAQGPDAIEVWNEQNIDFEWPAGQIDPTSYVNNMLTPAYNAIKACLLYTSPSPRD